MVAFPHFEQHLQLLGALGLPEASKAPVQAALTKAMLAGMGIPSLAEQGITGKSAGTNASLPNLGTSAEIIR